METEETTAPEATEQATEQTPQEQPEMVPASRLRGLITSSSEKDDRIAKLEAQIKSVEMSKLDEFERAKVERDEALQAIEALKTANQRHQTELRVKDVVTEAIKLGLQETSYAKVFIDEIDLDGDIASQLKTVKKKHSALFAEAGPNGSPGYRPKTAPAPKSEKKEDSPQFKEFFKEFAPAKHSYPEEQNPEKRVFQQLTDMEERKRRRRGW